MFTMLFNLIPFIFSFLLPCLSFKLAKRKQQAANDLLITNCSKPVKKPKRLQCQKQQKNLKKLAKIKTCRYIYSPPAAWEIN